MKIRTSQAAGRVGVDPAQLLLRLAELDSSLAFDDVWPEIDEAWLETLLSLDGHRGVRQGEAPAKPERQTSVRRIDLSDGAMRVVDKLKRQGKWGDASVSFEALQNLTRVPGHELKGALAELRKKGLLDRDGTGRGDISLNSGERNQIERIGEA